MKTRILFYIALVVLCGVPVVNAGVIDASGARAIALDFLTQSQGGNRLNSPQKDIQLAHIRYSSLCPSEPVFYIFVDDHNGGWAIVAADDRAKHILGYDFTGKFDVEAMPCNVSAWLDEYGHQIEYLQMNLSLETKSSSQTKPSINLSNINPLISSTWDQVYPYNEQCPKINNQYPFTGCTATAFAQVMYYYKYPTNACLAIPSYVTRTGGMTVPAIPSTTFDWDNMLDSYSGSYSNANKAAVAKLMRYCGQAVCMDYGLSSSAAYIELIPYALGYFFGYDKLDPAHMAARERYDDETWTQMLYDELSKGHPLPYAGSDGDGGGGGHTFVVDGYRNGSFHVNWGWGGRCDGYFQLSAFTPSTQDFTQAHRAVFGIDRYRVDVNGDGEVSIADVNAVINFILGGITDPRGDVNADNEVNIADFNAVINIILAGTSSHSEHVTETYTVNGVSFKMVKVDGGTFMMGGTAEQGADAVSSESPVHQVTLSTFYIGSTEVTQELWQAVMGTNPGVIPGPTLPITRVSWNDCQQFISKLNALTGKQFRLPTESEWEFAARGGIKSRGYKYSGSNDLASVGWFDENAGASYCMEVGLRSPNELGLYDMSGNVSEWCYTYWGVYPSTPQTNPQGPTTGTYRIYRGGSWYLGSNYCRVSSRSATTPDKATSLIGLRLAM